MLRKTMIRVVGSCVGRSGCATTMALARGGGGVGGGGHGGPMCGGGGLLVAEAVFHGGYGYMYGSCGRFPQRRLWRWVVAASMCGNGRADAFRGWHGRSTMGGFRGGDNLGRVLRP